MLFKEFDNPKGHKAMRTLVKILLWAMSLPMMLAFGGLPGGGANPLMSDSSSSSSTSEGTPASTAASAVSNEPGPAAQPPAGTPPGQSFVPFQAPGTEPPVIQPGQPPAAPVNTDATALMMQKFKDAGLTKFTDIDSFIKSYTSMEQMSGKHTAEKTQFQTQLDNLSQQIKSLTGNPNQQPGQPPQQQQPGQPPAQVQLTPEQKQAKNQALLESIMDDNSTGDVLEKFVTELLDKRLNDGPIAKVIESQQRNEQQQSYNNRASEFALKKGPDGQLLHKELAKPEVQNAMATFLDNVPALAENPAAFDIAYYFALGTLNVGQPQQAAPQQVDPASYLNDENFVNTHVLSNEKINQTVIQNYLQKVKDGQPPMTINSTTGGQPPAQPGESPKTTKEASGFLKRAWGLTK